MLHLLTDPKQAKRVFAKTADRRKASDASLVHDTIDHALRGRPVVLILDGFDQFNEPDRDTVRDLYRDGEDARSCHWIITSRVHSIDHYRSRDELFRDRDWLRVRIDPFSTQEQDAYFDKAPAKGAPIGRRWEEMVDREAMRELLSLPMVLSMIRLLIEIADERQETAPALRVFKPALFGHVQKAAGPSPQEESRGS